MDFYCYFTPWEFFLISVSWWFFHLVYESPQVSRNLLSIVANLNAVVRQSTFVPLFPIPPVFVQIYLVTVPRAPITIDIIVTFMFHSFFKFTCKVLVLIHLEPFFQFYSVDAGTVKSTILLVHSFLLIIIRSGRLAEIRWSVCIAKSQRRVFVSFSRTDSELCIYHLFLWPNFNLLLSLL